MPEAIYSRCLRGVRMAHMRRPTAVEVAFAWDRWLLGYTPVEGAELGECDFGKRACGVWSRA